MAPFHIAETREKAIENVRAGSRNGSSTHTP